MDNLQLVIFWILLWTTGKFNLIFSGLHHGSSEGEDRSLGHTSSGVSPSCGFYSGRKALSYSTILSEADGILH
jgi:hypothetical protein